MAETGKVVGPKRRKRRTKRKNKQSVITEQGTGQSHPWSALAEIKVDFENFDKRLGTESLRSPEDRPINFGGIKRPSYNFNLGSEVVDRLESILSKDSGEILDPENKNFIEQKLTDYANEFLQDCGIGNAGLVGYAQHRNFGLIARKRNA